VAESVVGRPLRLVAEHVVRATNRLELCSGTVVGVDVRMVLAGALSVRAFELLARRILVDAEQVVEVLGHTV
jgi:hypothetical protein